jgi:Lrp/AsnC family transcriptional regulator for asnA, asnC and gidA
MYIDEVDRKIIRELQEDSRKSFKAIAQELDISDATVHNRVKTLLNKGIIKRFTLLIDPSKVGLPVIFSINLEVEPKKIKETAEKLASVKGIYSVWVVAGTNNVSARARVEDLQKLQKMSNEVLGNLEGVRKVEIGLATQVIKEEKEVQI